MHDTLAPVSTKHFVFMSVIVTLMILESKEVEKFIEETTGVSVFVFSVSLSKGVPCPLAGGISYCEFCFFPQANSTWPL